jgi:hypothetical protein
VADVQIREKEAIDVADPAQNWVLLYTGPKVGYFGRLVHETDQAFRLTHYGCFEEGNIRPTSLIERHVHGGKALEPVVGPESTVRNIWLIGHLYVREDAVLEIPPHHVVHTLPIRTFSRFMRGVWRECITRLDAQREALRREMEKEEGVSRVLLV